MIAMIVESIDSVFDFGKYEGFPIKEVALIDPDYIGWLCKTVVGFIITNDIIDQLSNYCLARFFDNPELYLNEKGHFTLCSWQHLKYDEKEITIGGVSKENLLKLLSKKNTQPPARHISISLSRMVFNGEVCKKNLIDRKNENQNKSHG